MDTVGTPRPAARAASAAALAMIAAVLVVAARAEPPVTGARTGRRVELVELIHAEQARAAGLQRQVEELSAAVSAYEHAAASGAGAARRLQRRVDRILAPAGLTPVHGPGVTATLTDSTLASATTGNLNDLVVHEQDLQAVINALWAGGAEAMAVNGQRILATTAIRCVGNTLLLHGRVYSPPYEVVAIGDEVALRSALDRDPAVARFRQAVRDHKLGFDLAAVDNVQLPAADGSVLPGAQAGVTAAGSTGS